MAKRIILRILMLLGLVVVVLVVNLVIVNILASKVSEGTPIVDTDPENMALLVIDIQGGTTGNTSAINKLKEQSEQFIPRVNAVIEDFHNRGQLIVYIRTEVVNPLLNVLNNTMARGSEGAELDPRLLMEPGPVVVKRRGDSFIGTDLDLILTDHHIGTIVLTGLDATQCVKSTAQACINRGYHVVIVDSAVISKTETLKAEAMDDFREMGIEVLLPE
jgi:nicotinamidase/pyrazinamidase